ncbi:hypothetical protein QQ045_022103 [Rhodiola kirilowii]
MNCSRLSFVLALFLISAAISPIASRSLVEVKKPASTMLDRLKLDDDQTSFNSCWDSLYSPYSPAPGKLLTLGNLAVRLSGSLRMTAGHPCSLPSATQIKKEKQRETARLPIFTAAELWPFTIPETKSRSFVYFFKRKTFFSFRSQDLNVSWIGVLNSI